MTGSGENWENVTIPIRVSSRDERKILFYAIAHMTAARDQTSHEELDFKRVTDVATQPSDKDCITTGPRQARCVTGDVACWTAAVC